MTTDGHGPGRIRVQLVYAQPEGYWRTEISLPEGAIVADALAQAAPALDVADIAVELGCLAVFGKTVEAKTRLHNGDRIELLRTLLVNPRDARTRRAATSPKR